MKDRTGQVWELYSFGNDGWICLVVGPPLKERGKFGFTLHPMACLQFPSVIDDPLDYMPQSKSGAPVLEEDEEKPWEQDNCMERLV